MQLHLKKKKNVPAVASQWVQMLSKYQALAPAADTGSATHFLPPSRCLMFFNSP